jgi:hypothetical protein
MSNPSHLPIDSDVLIQLLVAGNLQPLQQLKKVYGIQATIVVEVENELRTNKKHKKHIQPNFDKAIAAGTIQVFDQNALQTFLSKHSLLLNNIGSTAWSTIQSTGNSYNLLVGIGEAYTHAAAVVLGVPSASHDKNALNVLENKGLTIPSPVLRTFDLIALCFQAGLLTEQECDGIRKTLLAVGEWLPQEFQNCSFEDGINNYSCRLSDCSRPSVGVCPTPKHSYEKRLLIRPN